MKFKKIMFVTFLLLAILTVSAVSAEENATADVAEIDDAVEIDEELNDDALGSEISDALAEDDKIFTFGDLTWHLNNVTSDEVYLEHDYVYIGPEYYMGLDGVNRTIVDKNGIYISHTLTIHGNGHTIDAGGAARIFNILGYKIVLKDINFVNGYSDNSNYSPIFWNETDGTISNCSFTNCHATYAGGAIYWNSVRGNITGCSFTNCYSDKGGAIYWNGYGGTVTDCKFENTYSNDPAGAIYWESDGGMVSGCNFIKCSSGQGGGAAIKMMGADGIVTDCTFDKCRGWTAAGWAGSGPIDWQGARGKVSNCNFKDSYSGRAAAINWEGVNGTVNNCDFENCSQTSYGTIYWISENGIVTDCNFTNCYEYGQHSLALGSAIYWEGANGTVNNSNFINCSGKYSGAGAIEWKGANGTLNNSNFINCSAEGGAGGAVSWSGANGIVVNSNFLTCFATGHGGAVAWFGDNGNISDSDFISCYADHGGAVHWNTRSDNINSNCSFFNCSATGNGGAIHWELSVGSVYDCNFTNCSAKNDGGALYDQHNSPFGDGVSVYRSIFVNNCANRNGGAYQAHAGDVVNCSFINSASGDRGGAIVGAGNVINSIFINSSASRGGAIDSSKDVINSSFYNCSANADGGAIKAVNNVINSSFYNCSAKANGGAIFDSKDVINSSFNDCYANGIDGAADTPGSVINSTFSNCRSLTTAGAIRASALVNNCNFTNCLSNESGGAIYLENNDGRGRILLSNSNFINCSANIRGGAVALEGRDYKAVNCSFINCSADYGGAVYKGIVENFTFYDNKATVEGDNWYLTSVPKLYLTVSNFSSTYGFDDALFFNATDKEGIAVNDVIITVRVYKNDTLVGTYDVMTNKNWTVGLDAGNYTAEMAVEHHAYELNKPVIVTLAIAKMPTELTSADILTAYGEDGYLTVTLKDIKGNLLADMPVSVDLNGAANYTTDENGTVKISTRGLNANVYQALIDFAGNSNYENSSAIANVTVAKSATSISSASVSTVYNGGKYLVVTLKDANGNPISGAKISININGVKTATTNKNGQAKLTTNGYAPKSSYTAKITFAGDKNYLASSKTAKVTVKKATPKLAAKAKTFKKSVKTKKYTVTLKTNQNKVMKNTKVTLKVNGKTYSAKTNSKGVATIKITKLTKKGKFTATVKYAGSKYYNAKSVKVKITVK